jgi:hypothetical protein
MKNYSLNKILIVVGQLFVIGLLCITVSCKDEPARLTGDVLPDGEMIKGHIYDGHILDTRNIAREQVRTDDATYGIIGEFKDPVFGDTKADFVTDFSLSSRVYYKVDSIYGVSLTTGNDTVYKGENNKGFEYHQFNNDNNDDPRFPYDTWEVDSLVLNLQYQFNNWYGDMLAKQNIQVYELNELLSTTQEYYNDQVIGFNPELVGEKEVHPNDEVPDSLKSDVWGNIWENPAELWGNPSYLWDVAKIDTVMESDFNGHTANTKIWSIKLNDDLRDRFFNMEEGDLSSTTSFKGEFNGLYVTSGKTGSVEDEGSLTKINLLSEGGLATNLTLYTKREHKYWKALGDNKYEVRDTVSKFVYNFPINIENTRFNKYQHTLETDIKLDDPLTEKLYIQGMAGSYMRMQLPDEVLTWVDSIGNPAPAEQFDNIDYHMVSNIEFFMEAAMDSGDVARYPIPERLTLRWMDEDGELVNPVYTIVVNGNKVSVPVFGTTNSQGNSVGSGERVVRRNDKGELEYLYRFIMRADYFNYIMRFQDGADLNEKVFYVGPENTTANFQRVILYSGAKANENVEVKGTKYDKRMKMNIKYYQYRPR